MDKLIDLFVNHLDIGKGIKIKGYNYWYDQDKGEVVIKVVTAKEYEGYAEEGEDDDPGNGGLPVRHRGPRVR